MSISTSLTGQDIGQAHKATRAVLERRLVAIGVEFEVWVVLNVLADQGSTATEGDLVARVVHGLKIDETAVLEVLSRAATQGLITRAAEVSLTPAGAEQVARIRAAVAEITERLYGGLPAEDLAVAHRVLATVTARANAELAA